MRIFDASGAERSWEWVSFKYNLPAIVEAPRNEDHWEIVEIHEQIGNSSMTVRVVGGEVAGIPIKFGWPDEAVVQGTNAEGHVGFGMGPGAYYKPAEGFGPHYVEVFARVSDYIGGLGMVGKTDHAHLEPTFRFVLGKADPEDNVSEALVALLDGLGEAVEDARGKLSFRR